MQTLRHRIAAVAVATVLATALFTIAPAPLAAAHASSSGFDDQYVFAATRGVNDMEGVHPALKVPLFPITILLDVAALPFAIIAGFVG